MIGYCSKLLFSVCLFLATFPLIVHGAPKELYADGQDYIKLPEQLRNNADVAQLLANDPNKIQVLFFFSYGCPACARFDPPFEKWVSKQKAKQVIVYRIPVAFKEEWETLAKLYFTMKYLDPKLSLDEKIFDAIHKQNLQLWQEPKMKEFFTQNGYNSKEFEQAYNSFSVARETKEAENLSKAYGIAQTPTIIVNGSIDSYQLNVSMAQNDTEKFFKILDYLVTKESKYKQKT